MFPQFTLRAMQTSAAGMVAARRCNQLWFSIVCPHHSGLMIFQESFLGFRAEGSCTANFDGRSCQQLREQNAPGLHAIQQHWHYLEQSV